MANLLLSIVICLFNRGSPKIAVDVIENDVMHHPNHISFATYFGFTIEETRSDPKLDYFLKIMNNEQKRKKLLRCLKWEFKIDSSEKFLQLIWQTVFCQNVPLPILEEKTLKVVEENPNIIGCTDPEINRFRNSSLIIKNVRNVRSE